MLLATSALASAALPATVAHAVDATWSATPADGTFSNAANWSGAAIPTGTATFGTSNTQDVTFTQGANLGGMTLTSGAGDYRFTANNNLDFNGAGFSVQSGASLTLNNQGGRSVSFDNAASAGTAIINNNGTLIFDETATAGTANITNDFAIFLHDTTSLGHAQIANATTGTLQFEQSSTADQANITSNGLLTFQDSSTAGRAIITNNVGGTLEFRNSSSAGNSTIDNSSTNVNFFDHSTAGRANITNETTGIIIFEGSASAGFSTITNAGHVTFLNDSTAANAIIVNDGTLGFQNTSTAGNASIQAHGTVLIGQQASGGTAHIALDDGTLDISGLTTAGTTIGSLEGNGSVLLGGSTLTVGGDDRITAFKGDIQGSGGLTKEGRGALTLVFGGTYTYTGATTVDAGTLVVDGNISSSSGVTVNAGGTLAGSSGTVPTTTINQGGTLTAGENGQTGQLNIAGDLTFTTGATYLVQVRSGSPSFADVSGTATLGGANVAANFAPGLAVRKRQIEIMFASGGITGAFNTMVKTNLSPIFATTLSYNDLANSVFLNVDVASPGASSGLNANQRNVGNALINAFNLAGGSLPGAFATLTSAGLTQVSGETAVGTQQATFDAMNQFMGVLLDPTVGGRGGAQANDAYAAMARKAAPLPADAFNARWGVWAAGFGGSQSTSGDAVLGSNKTSSNVFGSAVGADYRFSPNTIAGFALAGGGTNFNVASGGSGNSDLFQAGAYLRHTQGAVFLAAALAYGWQDVTTNRTVTAAGIDSLRANFQSNALSGRLEGGYRVATVAGNITPYAAAQFTTYRLPSYLEQAAFGANTFALGYSGKDVTATRTELGMKAEKAVPLADATLMLRGRLAWAHDFNTDRNVQATFQTLPGASFVVNGAQPAADTALTTIAAELLWRNGWSASATADARLSDSTHSYSGKGVVRYNW
jgi:autotransporter-associated beta strand protein